MVEQMRFELTTPTMRTWCSSQLSDCPNQYGDSNILLVFDLSSIESAFFEKKHRDGDHTHPDDFRFWGSKIRISRFRNGKHCKVNSSRLLPEALHTVPPRSGVLPDGSGGMVPAHCRFNSFSRAASSSGGILP